MALQDFIDYYKATLIRQYHAQPKAQATIASVVNCSLCDGLPQALQAAFDLDTAYGAQLTIIGKIVGIERNVYGIDLAHSFFGCVLYAGGFTSGKGFKLYSDADDEYLWLRYVQDATYTLTDFELLTLIKLRIFCNNNVFSLAAIKIFLFVLTEGAIDITDNADMTIDFDVEQPYYNAMIVLDYLNLLPKPCGVDATVNYV